MLFIQLFISFTIISIIYLLLLQYTKFFTYRAYLVKASLNLHFMVKYNSLYSMFFAVFSVYI